MAYIASMGTRGERLKKARIDAGYRTAKAAADALGIPYPTYASHENGSRSFDADDAIVYARKYKVSIEWLLEGKTMKVTPLPTSPLATIPVSGIVRAGSWQDVNSGDSTMYEYVPAASEAPAEWQIAYVVEGTSLNKIAAPGDKLLCLDIIKSGVEIKDGDLVIVERLRFGGQIVERTAKRIHRTMAGFELWPESNDPEHQQPIRLGGVQDGDEIRVTAKVLWILKKP